MKQRRNCVLRRRRLLEMAYYAALASLVHLLDDIILQYPNFFLCKHPIVKTLHEKFSSLEALLQDYSSKGDEASDNVEARIRDVAYRAQDVIEIEISDQIDTIGREPEFITSHELAVDELLKVEQDVDSIVKDLKVMTEDLQGKNNSAPTGTSTPTSTDITTMVGFEEYLIKIKDQLCGQSSQLQVIPIVGMGGIGKTTLARAAFDDPLSVYHFDRRAWVVVSQHYHANVLFLSILKSMGVSKDEFHKKEEETGFLEELIYKHLIGQRYLIVMDDVWNTKVWDDIKHAFPNGSHGSRILLTTRLLDVANYVRSSDFLYQVQFLDADASWSLLREKVFEKQDCPLELEDIGKSVARECRGLPLAIVVIAGVLLDSRATRHWEEVSKNVRSFLNKSEDEHLSNILSLSYNHLPHLLKACLLYIGSFPEDYEINVRMLVRLWVAEGFLKLIEGCETLEEAAEECLKDLVKRNLVLIMRKRANGKFKLCMMHDILRDFCRRRAVHESFFHGLDWERCLQVYESVTVSSPATESSSSCKPWEEYGARKHVRTILWFKGVRMKDASFFEKNSLRLLKTLYDAELRAAAPAFSRHFHVKYISLRIKSSKESLLSTNIFKLENLQTLNISCSKFALRRPIIVPTEFWQMVRLRHVTFHQGVILPPVPADTDMPVPVRVLEHLQTLHRVVDFKFSKRAVEMIPNLRKLKISCCSRDGSAIWELHGLSSLLHLHRLEELRIDLIFIYSHSRTSLGSDFAFPQYLNKLSLSGCGLPWNKMTLIRSLPSLQVLRLKINSFEGEEWEAIEGEFQQLKFLQMESLELKHWRADHMHFPRLQCLKIEECSLLEEIPMEIGEISALESITVYNCSSGVEESARLILEDQRSQGNDAFQVIVRRYAYSHW
ncbi:putative late blight resistance protein homolog R1C-3 isoform X2 [Andrographis paniculata]|uniref:putative late blight resistance protein homolog R1C-3 isoform X2 n=1 Tax=Andrographis paniculata TaxID=175694 RepID=UPI0021E982FF|nr:putative late blight resistance protein homolog R1C-3 isoform X2 [Andrographis paniculata]